MAVEEDPVAVAAAEAEVVVEVVVNKRRKKFKSRRVRRVRSRSGGWLVDGLLGCVAGLCFILAVIILIFIVSRVFDVRAGQSLTLVVAACVSGGLFYLSVRLHGKTSGGGGGSCSGCSGCSEGGGGDGGGDGGGCGGGGCGDD